MDTKKFLYSVRDEAKEIKQMEDRIQRLREKAEGMKGIAYDGVKVQTSHGTSMDEAVAEMIEYERTLREAVSKLCTKRMVAVNLIDSLQSSKERQVLKLYFLSGNHIRMQEVSEQIGYSERRTYDIYKAALSHLPESVTIE